MLNEEKRFIPIIITILILMIIFFSGCVEITCAYVKNSSITDGWNENTALRNTGIQFLGFEKWCSTTYEINGKYPASLTVTTLKSLVLSDEKEIIYKSKQTIEQTFQNNINLKENTSGERTLQNNHKTIYILYDGIDINKNESVKIICEIWNCADSGTSVVCIGIAYITNEEIIDVINTENWEKIVQDLKGTIDGYVGVMGLIDNINCH